MQMLTYSYTRAHLLETIKQVVTDNQPVCISRKGQTEAVLMSAQQFDQIKKEQKNFTARLTDWRTKNCDLMMSDGDFCPERQQDAGRNFAW